MNYRKEPLSFAAQADLLLTRGLIADRQRLIECLAAVNYYRLSAYWHTFRIPDDPDNRLMSGTTFDCVWRRYTFDRQLRLLVMDAVERVEIAVRTQIVNRHVIGFGPFGYLDQSTLPGLSVTDHRKLLEKIRYEAQNSREDFVRHFCRKYTAESGLPLWMACELMTFGTMLALFTGLRTRTKKDVARHYGLNAPVLGSWLRMLNQVRNICAHHARLWNRVYGVKAVMPEAAAHPVWHAPVPVGNDQTFAVLTLLRYLLKQVAPRSQWERRLERLFFDYSDVPLRFMGFPENWKDCPLWQHNEDSV